jgi:hypothetical protein
MELKEVMGSGQYLTENPRVGSSILSLGTIKKALLIHLDFKGFFG